jgi:hypothetical protein
MMVRLDADLGDYSTSSVVDKVAKFWLDPIRLQESGGFSRQDIGRIRKLVIAHQDRLEGGME